MEKIWLAYLSYFLFCFVRAKKLRRVFSRWLEFQSRIYHQSWLRRLLDLSAAFDTIDHQVLLNRLRLSFGIRGYALEWIASYLSDRTQRVSFENYFSQSRYLSCGVPQGSYLGPLLFTMYASKLFDIIKGHLPRTHSYADDTQLYLSFRPDTISSQSNAVDAMERCNSAIRCWMIKDKLKVNDSKIEFILIRTRQQLAKVDIKGLVVGDATISPVTAVKNLNLLWLPLMTSRWELIWKALKKTSLTLSTRLLRCQTRLLNTSFRLEDTEALLVTLWLQSHSHCSKKPSISNFSLNFVFSFWLQRL